MGHALTGIDRVGKLLDVPDLTVDFISGERIARLRVIYRGAKDHA